MLFFWLFFWHLICYFVIYFNALLSCWSGHVGSDLSNKRSSKLTPCFAARQYVILCTLSCLPFCQWHPSPPTPTFPPFTHHHHLLCWCLSVCLCYMWVSFFVFFCFFKGCQEDNQLWLWHPFLSHKSLYYCYICCCICIYEFV